MLKKDNIEHVTQSFVIKLNYIIIDIISTNKFFDHQHKTAMHSGVIISIFFLPFDYTASKNVIEFETQSTRKKATNLLRFIISASRALWVDCIFGRVPKNKMWKHHYYFKKFKTETWLLAVLKSEVTSIVSEVATW